MVERDRNMILDYNYVGYELGIKELIPFPCLDVRNWVWEMIEQMTEISFSYVHEFIWYEVGFVILDIITLNPHHNLPL